MADQAFERSVYKVIIVERDGLPMPAVLVKFDVCGDAQLPPASQTSPQSKRARLGPQVSLTCTATRLANGQQQYATFALPDNTIAKLTQKTGHSSSLQALNTILDLVDGSQFETDAPSSEQLQIRFTEHSDCDILLDFSSGKHAHATPPYALAMQAVEQLHEELAKVKEAQTRAEAGLHASERDFRNMERKYLNSEQELQDNKTKLQRLLATGNSDLISLTDTGRGRSALAKKRAASRDDLSVDEMKPVKRKAAEPSLVKAGRTIQKHIPTGFVDDDDDGNGSSASDQPDASAQTRKGQPAKRDKRGHSSSKSSDVFEDRASVPPSQQSKKPSGTSGAPSLHSGRTLQKKVDPAFVDDDDDERTQSE